MKALPNQNKVGQKRAKKERFSMAVKKVDLTHECFPKHLTIETARTNVDKETEEEDKQKRVKMKGSEVGTK